MPDKRIALVTGANQGVGLQVAYGIHSGSSWALIRFSARFSRC
jgi:NAD(P)-dependent dehydrogenase (short-subunit alcohol dehydrogenase family)